MGKVKLYVSFDIEADGPVPTKNSMLSIGIVFLNGTGKEIRSYQRNIKPLDDRVQDEKCMTEFWSQFPDIWKFITSNQVTGKEFVLELEIMLKELDNYDIIWVAHPSAYDWQWLKNYYELFKSENARNIGFSCKCISTLFWAYYKINGLNNKKDQEAFYDKLAEGFTLTHNPEDDARRQGKAFVNLCKLLGIEL